MFVIFKHLSSSTIPHSFLMHSQSFLMCSSTTPHSFLICSSFVPHSFLSYSITYVITFLYSQMSVVEITAMSSSSSDDDLTPAEMNKITRISSSSDDDLTPAEMKIIRRISSSSDDEVTPAAACNSVQEDMKDYSPTTISSSITPQKVISVVSDVPARVTTDVFTEEDVTDFATKMHVTLDWL